MTEQDKMQFISYMSLKDELDTVKYGGVKLCLDGESADPHVIATACVFNEDFDYMRNYTRTEDGNILKLGFDKIDR